MNSGSRKLSTFTALQNPVFRRLWLASLISGTCVAAHDTAAGADWFFAANAICFIAAIFVLLPWKRVEAEAQLPLENFFESLSTAIRYVRCAPDGVRVKEGLDCNAPCFVFELIRKLPYSRLRRGFDPEEIAFSCVLLRMKRLFLALTVLVSLVGFSLTALADEDRRDRDWNDEYWHHEHYGYWHGERGYWRYHHHRHEFVRVGPLIIEERH